MANKKILWVTNSSTTTSRALPLINDRVRIEAAEVHLLYVTEDLTQFEEYWGSGPDAKHAESLKHFAERQSKKRMQEICECELEGCSHYELHFAHGPTVEKILEAIDEIGPDEVIAAKPPTEGATSFGAAVDEVLAKSPVPVTALDAPPAEGPPSCDDRG